MSSGEEEQKGITRREFIKGAAVGAAAVAGAGALASCGPAPAPECPECPPCPTPEAAVPEKADFEVPPPPIPASDIKETLTADVVVVGAGTAGLPAALSAAQAGASVILIEKNVTYRADGGDNTAIDSRIQRAIGLEIDKNKVIRALMRWGGNRPDQRLLELWADNCGKVIDWIMEILDAEGLESFLVVPDRGDEETAVIDTWPNPPSLPAGWYYEDEYVVEYPTCHRLGSLSRDQRLWLGVIEKNALESGVDIRYETKAEQLLRLNNGRGTGVVATNADGDYIQFNANKAVVLCTGDYGANPAMMAKYNPGVPFLSWAPTCMGEGHQMGMWIGAVMEDTPHAPMTHMFTAMGTDAFLQVNKYGERFQNEDVDTQSLGNQCQEQGGLWVVVDSSWPEDVPHMGAGFFRIFEATDTVRAEFEAKVENGTFLKADTIEELAEKMEVPVETFKATIDRYNELAYMGEDLDFGKRADRLTPVDEPPYYASWSAGPGMLVCLGGLIVNDHLQALDADNQIIPGLYLAGNTVGRRFKNDYPVMLPGLSHSMAWTHGYLAGKYAAEEKV